MKNSAFAEIKKNFWKHRNIKLFRLFSIYGKCSKLQKMIKNTYILGLQIMMKETV